MYLISFSESAYSTDTEPETSPGASCDSAQVDAAAHAAGLAAYYAAARRTEAAAAAAAAAGPDLYELMKPEDGDWVQKLVHIHVRHVLSVKLPAEFDKQFTSKEVDDALTPPIAGPYRGETSSFSESAIRIFLSHSCPRPVTRGQRAGRGRQGEYCMSLLMFGWWLNVGNFHVSTTSGSICLRKRISCSVGAGAGLHAVASSRF